MRKALKLLPWKTIRFVFQLFSCCHIQALVILGANPEVGVPGNARAILGDVSKNRLCPRERTGGCSNAGPADADGFPTLFLGAGCTSAIQVGTAQGKKLIPKEKTEVRYSQDPEALYLRFRVRYRSSPFFSDAEPNVSPPRPTQEPRRRGNFPSAGTDASQPLIKNCEVSPNEFLDRLDIGTGEKTRLKSGLRAALNEAAKPGRGDGVPMKCLVER